MLQQQNLLQKNYKKIKLVTKTIWKILLVSRSNKEKNKKLFRTKQRMVTRALAK